MNTEELVIITVADYKGHYKADTYSDVKIEQA